MPSSKKPISRMPQDERRREIADIYVAANKGTKHFINKEGSLVTSIPLESEDIRRLARLERSAKSSPTLLFSITQERAGTVWNSSKKSLWCCGDPTTPCTAVIRVNQRAPVQEL